jgi:hypothetical protein
MLDIFPLSGNYYSAISKILKNNPLALNIFQTYEKYFNMNRLFSQFNISVIDNEKSYIKKICGSITEK